MSFSSQDIALLKQAKAQGKTKEQALAQLAQSRAKTPVAEEPTINTDTTMARLDDVGTDVGNTISQALTGQGQFQGNTPLNRGVSAVASGFSAVPRGALAMAPEPVRSGVERVGDFIGKGFNKLTGAIGGTDLFQGAVGRTEMNENNIPVFKPNDLGVLEDTLGTVSAGGEIAGNITGAQGVVRTLTDVGNLTNKAAQASMKASDDLLNKVKGDNPTVRKGNFITNAVNDARFNLSDIDPQVETVLQRSNFDEVNTYFQKAQAAKADPSKSTPLEIAGNKAETAFDAINDARIKAIEGKKAILAEAGDTKIAGNQINEVMSAGIQKMGDKYGVKIDANGNISPLKGRTSTLDATDAKLVSQYYSKLNSLGVSPTLKQVDDFVDWAQGQLYKQSKTLSKLDAAGDPIIRDLQGVTGDLNGRLKTAVGNGYGEVNARVSGLIELQDELSRALGADARKGGGLMKKLFSPTGGNTKEIFAQIQQETGIDLFKEATLAKFAMESAGDVRQASLLKQLDVNTADAVEIDLARPATLIKFIRERADMDGQQLANEIIRRSNASQP